MYSGGTLSATGRGLFSENGRLLVSLSSLLMPRRARLLGRTTLLILLAVALVAAACGGDDDSNDADSASPSDGLDAQSQAAADDAPAPSGARDIEPIEAEASAVSQSTGGASGGDLISSIDLSALESARISAVFQLALSTPPSQGTASFEELLLALVRDVTIEGAFTADGDFDVSIDTGAASPLPPIGIRSVGGVLYTNFGFGWTEGADSLGGLLGGLGVDFESLLGDGLTPTDDAGGLDLSSLGALDSLGGLGDLDAFPIGADDPLGDLQRAGFEKQGTRTIGGVEGDVWTASTDTLLAILGGADSGLSADSLSAELVLESETSFPLHIAVSGSGLAIDATAADGSTETSTVDEFVLTLTLDFETGVPTLFQLDLIGLDAGEDGLGVALTGDLVLRLEITDLNGAVSIEVPPLG